MPDTSTAPHALYIEVPGCTAHTTPGGERCTTVHIVRELGRPVGAFLSSQERDAMFYLTLGASTGARRQYMEVLDAREVTREEFDELTGIDAIRREMGWTW